MRGTVRIRSLVLALIGTVALVGAAIAPASDGEDPGTGVAAAKKKKGGSGGKGARITGSLDKRGYTVIALSDSSTNGSVATVKRSKFKLRVPLANRTKGGPVVTLHLRAPDGSYGGPIVLAGKPPKGAKVSGKGKKRVVVGVKVANGADLGAIAIKSGKGYARTKRMPAKKLVKSKRVAQATKGIPIGNGRNVGLVLSTAAGPPSDLDLDGVPNSLDVDVNGNLILNNVDPAVSATPSASRAARRSLNTPHPAAFMSLGTSVAGDTVNAYGSTDAEIATALRTQLTMGMQYGGVDPGSAELDCGALGYCSVGGTGRLPVPPTSSNFATAVGFPRPCCDADNDGFGTLQGTATKPDFYGMRLFPGATPDQIRSGDILIMRATRDGAPVSPVSSLGSVLTTFSALATFDDGQGNSGGLTYPLDGKSPEVFVRADGSGDVVMDLALWRPQRLRIPTEPGSEKWMDVGSMNYFASPQSMGQGPGLNACPASTYSAVGPSLSPQPADSVLPAYHLADQKADQPTDRSKPLANTVNYRLNLTDCAASYGLTFAVTESRSFAFWAAVFPSTGKPGTATSLVTFTRIP